MKKEGDESVKGAETTPAQEHNRGEREPKINLKFFYAPHGKPDDWKKLAELLPWADGYAIESPGYGEEEEVLYDSISAGTGDLEDAKRQVGPPFDKELELLHNSHKPIIFIDVPPRHPALAKAYEGISIMERAIRDFSRGRFEEALAGVDRHLRLSGEETNERDEYMKLRIKSLVGDVKENLKLEGKEVNILVRIGGEHLRVSRNLGEKGISSEDVFSEDPTVFPFGAEGRRRIDSGREPSRDLLGKILMEELLGKVLWPLTDSSNSLVYLLRQIISRLTLNDIKHISSSLARGSSLTSEIEARGIQIPKTVREADVMIKEITKKWGPHRAKNQNLP